MANPEWGTKRICQNCGTKFYDLLRDPIVCPKCHATFDPEALLRTRRRGAVATEKEAEATAGDIDTEAGEEAELEEEVAADETVEEEDEDLIEDASELGEDEDDMAEVIENVDEEEER